MTEADWLAGGEPGQLTEAAVARGWVSDRKLRLWACACCRRIWTLLVDEPSRTAVEVAERFADGVVTEAERVEACDAALAGLTFQETPEQPESAGWQAAAYAASDAADDHLVADQHEFVYRTTSALSSVAVAKDPWLSRHWDTTRKYRDRLEKFTEAVEATEKLEQARLVRDVVGNPFRPVTIDPVWLTPTVRALAQGAYDDRILPNGQLDSARLAILADALEDAGCQDAQILEHCRGKGPHVRGCWLIDLLTGHE